MISVSLPSSSVSISIFPEVEATKELKSLQKSTLSAIQNAVGGVKSSLTGNLAGVTASYSNISETLSNTARSFNLNKQETEQRVEVLETQVFQITQTLEKTAGDLIALNDKQDETTLNVTNVVDELKSDQLQREKDKEKALRLETADKRREIKEHCKASTDHGGRKCCGLAFNWDCKARKVHVSMPGHVQKALQ